MRAETTLGLILFLILLVTAISMANDRFQDTRRRQRLSFRGVREQDELRDDMIETAIVCARARAKVTPWR